MSHFLKPGLEPPSLAPGRANAVRIDLGRFVDHLLIKWGSEDRSPDDKFSIAVVLFREMLISEVFVCHEAEVLQDIFDVAQAMLFRAIESMVDQPTMIEALLCTSVLAHLSTKLVIKVTLPVLKLFQSVQSTEFTRTCIRTILLDAEICLLNLSKYFDGSGKLLESSSANSLEEGCPTGRSVKLVGSQLQTWEGRTILDFRLLPPGEFRNDIERIASKLKEVIPPPAPGVVGQKTPESSPEKKKRGRPRKEDMGQELMRDLLR